MAILKCIVSFATCFAISQVHAAEPIQLSFDDLLHRPIGALGIDIGSSAKKVQGQKIRIRGFMVKSEENLFGQFYLTSLPIQMSEHADGPANDLPASAVLVRLDPSQSTWVVAHQPGPIVLEGILSIGRYEDALGNVSWFQLQLPIH